MKKKSMTLLLFIVLLFPNSIFGQKKDYFEIATLFKKGEVTVVNREIQIISNDNAEYLQVSESKKEGIVWLPIKEFENGTIEIEMRGKDLFQQSFIGIVFHGLNDSTYDAVYCRPFNFFAKDSIRRIHAIQYISHPVFTWKKLRNERNAVFEKEIINPPDPNGWFTMKLVIDKTTVNAYINNAAQPTLTVTKLTKRARGRIGLFTADGSGGDFKSLRVDYKN
jgi:hypothetical protein